MQEWKKKIEAVVEMFVYCSFTGSSFRYPCLRRAEERCSGCYVDIYFEAKGLARCAPPRPFPSSGSRWSWA